MRVRLGRPDLSRHSDLFAVPEAGQGLSVTFLGVSTLLLDDGTSALRTDGYLTRPGLARVAVGRVAPDRPRVEAALRRAAVRELEGVLPVHTHVDHALDSALVAELTDAPVVGGRSAAHVARGHGLPEEQVRVVSTGDTLTLGAYEVTWVESGHCPPDRYPGEITADVVPPVRVSAYGAVRRGPSWCGTRAAGPPSSRGAPASCPVRWRGAGPRSPTSGSVSSASRTRSTSAATGPRRSRPSGRGASSSSTGTTSSRRWTGRCRRSRTRPTTSTRPWRCCVGWPPRRTSR